MGLFVQFRNIHFEKRTKNILIKRTMSDELGRTIQKVAEKYAAKRAETIFEFVVFCFKRSKFQTLSGLLRMFQSNQFEFDEFDDGVPSCSEAELSTVLNRLCELGQVKKDVGNTEFVYEWADDYYGGIKSST